MGNTSNVSILGSGSVGFSMAYQMFKRGLKVVLWNRPSDRIEKIVKNNSFVVKELNGDDSVCEICHYSTNINEVADMSDLIFITTPAYAHKEIFESIRIKDLTKKIFVLVPGRTFGCLEACSCLNNDYATVLEMQTVPYACRIVDDKLELMGKKTVLYASSPKNVDAHIKNKIRELIPEVEFCDNYLDVTINNIGALLHPIATILNSARIQSGNAFMFYSEGMSPVVTNFIEAIDNEKKHLCNALGCKYMSVKEWVEKEYLNCKTGSLLEALNMAEAYKKVPAPRTLDHRYIYDDIKTGLVPLYLTGKIFGLDMVKTKTFIEFTSQLLNWDFISNGRQIDKEELIKWNLYR